MTAFRWRDRHGIEHVLDSCAPIEAEHRAVTVELLALRERLRSEDDTIYLAARRVAAPLLERLVALGHDLETWDKACEQEIRATAQQAREAIGGIIVEARHLRALHASYDQYLALTGSSAEAARMPPSSEQLTVLAEDARRNNRYFTRPVSFEQAHRMLVASATTNRIELPPAFPTFEWADRHGHNHQLRSSLGIEREYVELADEIVRLLPNIYPEIELRKCAVALEKIRLAVDRVSLLEQSMDNWTSFVVALDRESLGKTLDALETFHGSRD